MPRGPRGLRGPRTLRALALSGSLCSGCLAGAGDPGDGAGGGADAGPARCPDDGVSGAGRHRLFVQGREGPGNPNGRWPLLHERAAPGEADARLCDDTVFVADDDGDGVWEPGEHPAPLGPKALAHGEHFLVGAGAFVELEALLCADIDGEVAFYLPNYDEEGSRALHQLFVVQGGVEQLVAEAEDAEAGESGYNPFVRVLHGADPDARPGDTLLLRSTNLNGVPFSVMVWRPPSEYESWILVNVP